MSKYFCFVVALCVYMALLQSTRPDTGGSVLTAARKGKELFEVVSDTMTGVGSQLVQGGSRVVGVFTSLASLVSPNLSDSVATNSTANSTATAASPGVATIPMPTPAQPILMETAERTAVDKTPLLTRLKAELELAAREGDDRLLKFAPSAEGSSESEMLESATEPSSATE